jgi:hypothetical protein
VRQRLSYANVTATLALFFAMSGGALAAKHYLLTSTKQISPKVLKALKGNQGPRGLTGAIGATGATGAPGAAGKEGAPGKEGPAGPYPTVLASGATESGDWGAGQVVTGAKAFLATAASFPIPLAAGLDKEHVIYVSGSSATHCSGAGHAQAGYLCVYQGDLLNANAPESGSIFNPEAEAGPKGAGPHGFAINLESKEPGRMVVGGSFAVTAP